MASEQGFEIDRRDLKWFGDYNRRIASCEVMYKGIDLVMRIPNLG
jgi:hypothetical protein